MDSTSLVGSASQRPAAPTLTDSTSTDTPGRWSKVSDSFRYIVDTLDYLFCKPLDSREVEKTPWNSLKYYTSAITNRFGLALFAGTLAGGTTLAFTAGCKMLSNMPARYLQNNPGALAAPVATMMLTTYVCGRIGQQAGKAADTLLADRQIRNTATEEPQSFLQRNRCAVTLAALGALSAPAIMLAGVPSAAAGIALLERGVVAATVTNSIVQGALGFIAAHLENRAASLKAS